MKKTIRSMVLCVLLFICSSFLAHAQTAAQIEKDLSQYRDDPINIELYKDKKEMEKFDALIAKALQLKPDLVNNNPTLRSIWNKLHDIKVEQSVSFRSFDARTKKIILQLEGKSKFAKFNIEHLAGSTIEGSKITTKAGSILTIRENNRIKNPLRDEIAEIALVSVGKGKDRYTALRVPWAEISSIKENLVLARASSALLSRGSISPKQSNALVALKITDKGIEAFGYGVLSRQNDPIQITFSGKVSFPSQGNVHFLEGTRIAHSREGSIEVFLVAGKNGIIMEENGAVPLCKSCMRLLADGKYEMNLYGDEKTSAALAAQLHYHSHITYDPQKPLGIGLQFHNPIELAQGVIVNDGEVFRSIKGREFIARKENRQVVFFEKLDGGMGEIQVGDRSLLASLTNQRNYLGDDPLFVFKVRESTSQEPDLERFEKILKELKISSDIPFGAVGGTLEAETKGDYNPFIDLISRGDFLAQCPDGCSRGPFQFKEEVIHGLLRNRDYRDFIISKDVSAYRDLTNEQLAKEILNAMEDPKNANFREFNFATIARYFGNAAAIRQDRKGDYENLPQWEKMAFLISYHRLPSPTLEAKDISKPDSLPGYQGLTPSQIESRKKNAEAGRYTFLSFLDMQTHAGYNEYLFYSSKTLNRASQKNP